MIEKCPRCGDKLPETEPQACYRCTWPVRPFDRIYVTLAKREADGNLNHSLSSLEGFIAGLNDQNVQTLTDPKGRKLKAKVFEVIMKEDSMEVTFEFNPLDWKYPDA